MHIELHFVFNVQYSDLLNGHFFSLQESIKTKHPQLHYESKLYMLLQGGSEYMHFVKFECFFLFDFE